MAAAKKATHIIKHPKLNLSVDGKLQRMKVGTPITLTGKAAKSLEEKGFIEKIGSQTTTDIDDGETKKAGSKAKTEADKKAEADALAEAEKLAAEANK